MELFIRKETKNNEFRTPLTPSDCRDLINKNFNIYIENSNERCFSDKEYLENGCSLTNIVPKNFTVIGLKELDENSDFYQYKNIYFSHCFKNQINSEKILKKFKENGGKILDYEYIVDNNNKRLIAFGFWAGFSGMYLGLLQYFSQKDISNIKPCDDFNKLLNELKNIKINPKIVIIGVNGRCGKGCTYLLNKLNLNYTGFTKKDKIDNLKNFEIIVNCIFLNANSKVCFINPKNFNEFKNLKIIVDISCDIYAKNNPINIPYSLTSFSKPICKYKNIDIIAIDNLPTLLPKDSSKEFSNNLKNLLLNKNIWSNLENLYLSKIKNI